MSFLDKIASWFTSPRQFTDEQLLAGPPGDTIDHGFHFSEEDYIRVLEHRKKTEHLSERQVRLINIRIADQEKRIRDRETYLQEQAEAKRRRLAEEAANEIDKRPTPSVRVPQPSSGGSTVKSGKQLVDRVADFADSVPTYATSIGSHSQSPATHTASASHSVSYSSHKSCSSSSYDGGSSSSSSDSSSSSGGCD